MDNYLQQIENELANLKLQNQETLNKVEELSKS